MRPISWRYPDPGSISSECKTFEHWRSRTPGAIKPRPACKQRERK